MEIGKKIKLIREQKGLSMQELADLSGFKSRQSIEQIERSVSSPTITTLTRAAKGLGVKLVIDLIDENQ